MTYTEFKDYYKEYGMAKGDAFRRKNKYTEKELITRYNKYNKTHNIDDKTLQQKLREKAIKRDGNKCQLYKKLSLRDKILIDEEMKTIGCYDLDMAHVFEKSVYPNLKNDLDNVVMLKRVIHNRLDTGKDPITGSPVDPLIISAYWEYIIGEERYQKLLQKVGR